MFKKFMLMFKVGWLCSVVTALVTGLSSFLVVVDYIIDAIEGTELGDKVIGYLEKGKSFSSSALSILIKVSGFVCSKSIVLDAKKKGIEFALQELEASTNALNEL